MDKQRLKEIEAYNISRTPDPPLKRHEEDEMMFELLTALSQSQERENVLHEALSVMLEHWSRVNPIIDATEVIRLRDKAKKALHANFPEKPHA